MRFFRKGRAKPPKGQNDPGEQYKMPNTRRTEMMVPPAATSPQSPVSSTANRLENLSMQDRRREGIYRSDTQRLPTNPAITGQTTQPLEIRTAQHRGVVAPESHPATTLPTSTADSLQQQILSSSTSTLQSEPESFQHGRAQQEPIGSHRHNKQNQVKGLPQKQGQDLLTNKTSMKVGAEPSIRSLTQGCINAPAIDIDRDETGTLLSNHQRPPHIQRLVPKTASTPKNFYTTPKRLESAIAVSTSNLKRKRITQISPPAHVYIHTGDPDFNIFSNGFLFYPELCIALAAQMPLRDLIGLYAISKDFHTIIDSRFTTVCLMQAVRKAPQSAKVFPFRSWSQFCREDPISRIPHPDPTKAAMKIPRCIPSFRWVGFVLHREKVVHELCAVFAERGCPLPARCTLAMKRMWQLMDVPDNARRIALIHHQRTFTDLDLYFLMCFFVKLDMVAHDPLAAEKQDGLRRLLLLQPRGLDTMLQVLKRDEWRKRSDFAVEYVKSFLTIPEPDIRQMEENGIKDIFGVPIGKVGLGKYEYWGSRGVCHKDGETRRSYLLTPDQLVMREVIRRGLRFSKHFLRCLLYGYVRPDTLENYAPRPITRRIPEWKGEDYDILDNLGAPRALAVEDGGDPLLDLGDTSCGSVHTVKKAGVDEQEAVLRKSQAEYVKQLYEISAEEREPRTTV